MRVISTDKLRTALVTGGNRGIGLEVCRRLGTLGYRVLLAGRNRHQAEAAASSLRQEGPQVLAQVLDVTDASSIRAMAEGVEREFGGADVLVNNAAILLAEDGNVLRVPADDFRQSMETNVYGPLQLCQALMPGMLERGYGRVVNVSSGAGQLATMNDYAPPYSLSKTALNALTRLLAASGRTRNVRSTRWIRAGCAPTWAGPRRRAPSNRGRTRSSGVPRSRTVDPRVASFTTAGRSRGDVLRLPRPPPID